MSTHVPDQKRRRRAARWAAGAVFLAMIIPSIGFSTVPPIPKREEYRPFAISVQKGTSKWAGYCISGALQSPTSAGQSSVTCGNPSADYPDPTYWMAYHMFEFVWKNETYRFEVTVPFNFWATRPPESRIEVDTIKVELTGPRPGMLMSRLSLNDGRGHIVCSTWGPLNLYPPYTTEHYCSSFRVNEDNAMAYVNMDWSSGGARPGESVPLPIIPEQHEKISEVNGYCPTQDGEDRYRCHLYSSITRQY